MALRKVDPQARHLTEQESKAIKLMLAKRENYVLRGRAWEAHGAGTAIVILWDCLNDFEDTRPTGWDDV